MGTWRRSTATALLLSLFAQLLTLRLARCAHVGEKSTTTPTTPTTAKILVEEIILAGGVDNTGLPAGTIIADPGGAKGRILSRLVRADRRGRATPGDVGVATPSETLIIGVEDARDLENLEHILAASEYEPRRIDGRKFKRRIDQDSGINSGPRDSLLDSTNITAPQGKTSFTDSPRRSRLTKERKKAPDETKPSTESTAVKSTTSRLSATSKASAENDDRSTIPPSTTQRLKRRPRTEQVAGIAGEVVTPIPYASLLSVAKNPSRRGPNNAVESAATATTRSRNAADSEEIGNREGKGEGIAEESKETEETRLAATTVGKSADVISAGNDVELVADSASTKKRKKKRRIPQRDGSLDRENIVVADDFAKNDPENRSLAGSLEYLAKYNMVPRPFSLPDGHPLTTGVVGSASETSQTRVGTTPQSTTKNYLEKSLPTSTSNENLVLIEIRDAPGRPSVTLDSVEEISLSRENLGPTAKPINDETQNFGLLANNFDVATADVENMKTDPVAAFVNDLTSMSFGNAPKKIIQPYVKQAETTAGIDDYANQQNITVLDLSALNNNPAVLSLLHLPRISPNSDATRSYDNLDLGADTFRQTLEANNQANVYYLPPVNSLPTSTSPALQTKPIEEPRQILVQPVDTGIYINFAGTTVPSLSETSTEVSNDRYSDETEKIAYYDDSRKSKKPLVESYEDYEGPVAPKAIGRSGPNVLDPYVTSTSRKNVVSRANAPSSSNPARTHPGSSIESSEDSRSSSSSSSEEDIDSDRSADAPERNPGAKRSAYRSYQVHETPESDDLDDRREETRYRADERDEKRNYRDGFGQDQKRDYSDDRREERKREYQDQKQDHTERHQRHDRAGKDDESKDQKYEKGGGTEYEEDRHSAEGSKGEKAYESKHEHEKKEKGHHDKERHSNHYSEDDGVEKKHHDEGGYHDEHHRAEKGEKSAEFGEKGEHKKGHSTKGAHVVHKKDEFEKKTEFFDEFHEDSDADKEGEFHHEHEHGKGGHEKYHRHEADEHEEGHGKKGEHVKGGRHEEMIGREVKEDRDSRHEHEERQGKKAGQEKGEKWAFKKARPDDEDRKEKKTDEKE